MKKEAKTAPLETRTGSKGLLVVRSGVKAGFSDTSQPLPWTVAPIGRLGGKS